MSCSVGQLLRSKLKNLRTKQLLKPFDWIAMGFCTDIHGPQVMNQAGFDDPPSFHLMPLRGAVVMIRIKIDIEAKPRAAIPVV